MEIFSPCANIIWLIFSSSYFLDFDGWMPACTSLSFVVCVCPWLSVYMRTSCLFSYHIHNFLIIFWQSLDCLVVKRQGELWLLYDLVWRMSCKCMKRIVNDRQSCCHEHQNDATAFLRWHCENIILMQAYYFLIFFFYFFLFFCFIKHHSIIFQKFFLFLQ